MNEEYIELVTFENTLKERIKESRDQELKEAMIDSLKSLDKYKDILRSKRNY